MEIFHKPWGYYTILDKGDKYQVKRLSVAPGGRLSLQSHAHREENWVIVYGEAQVTVYDIVRILDAGTAIYIPVDTKHRLENLTDDWVHVIETQYGSYLGEDDIVRYEDIYKRIPEYSGVSER
jgi:mannose-6-phosphate isomerase-like protein (cupin superfamily)